MVTYLITAGQSEGSYVLAWEDGSNLGDKDYQDLVIEVSGVALNVPPSAVPTPSAVFLGTMGKGIVG